MKENIEKLITKYNILIDILIEDLSNYLGNTINDKINWYKINGRIFTLKEVIRDLEKIKKEK